MEVAMKLLEKDVHEKQDTIVSLRDQLEDIRNINLEMYTKLQVHYCKLFFFSRNFSYLFLLPMLLTSKRSVNLRFHKKVTSFRDSSLRPTTSAACWSGSIICRINVPFFRSCKKAISLKVIWLPDWKESRPPWRTLLKSSMTSTSFLLILCCSCYYSFQLLLLLIVATVLLPLKYIMI